MKQSLETLLAKSNKHFDVVFDSAFDQVFVYLYTLPANEDPVKLSNNRIVLSIKPVKQKYSVKQISGKHIAKFLGYTGNKETIAKYIAEWFQKI